MFLFQSIPTTLGNYFFSGPGTVLPEPLQQPWKVDASVIIAMFSHKETDTHSKKLPQHSQWLWHPHSLGLCSGLSSAKSTQQSPGGWTQDRDPGSDDGVLVGWRAQWVGAQWTWSWALSPGSHQRGHCCPEADMDRLTPGLASSPLCHFWPHLLRLLPLLWVTINSSVLWSDKGINRKLGAQDLKSLDVDVFLTSDSEDQVSWSCLRSLIR